MKKKSVMKQLFFLLTTLLVLVACSPNQGRYALKQDTAPHRIPTEAEMLDPTPKYEPYSRQGNRSYRLFGVNYQIIEQAEGYSEEGIASWYGRKFHGHLTSNGEYFDMFNMTAAHKTLPLPSYIQVTNLDNNQQAIVRVNDRGPFHSSRILDLSYAAAYRLGITETGTAPVRIEVITVNPTPLKQPKENNKTSHAMRHESTDIYVQVVASQQFENILNLSDQLKANYQVNVKITYQAPLYRLLIGPFNTLESARWLDTLS